jgi:hypothetical protein
MKGGIMAKKPGRHGAGISTSARTRGVKRPKGKLKDLEAKRGGQVRGGYIKIGMTDTFVSTINPGNK